VTPVAKQWNGAAVEKVTMDASEPTKHLLWFYLKDPPHDQKFQTRKQLLVGHPEERPEVMGPVLLMWLNTRKLPGFEVRGVRGKKQKFEMWERTAHMCYFAWIFRQWFTVTPWPVSDLYLALNPGATAMERKHFHIASGAQAEMTLDQMKTYTAMILPSMEYLKVPDCRRSLKEVHDQIKHLNVVPDCAQGLLYESKDLLYSDSSQLRKHMLPTHILPIKPHQTVEDLAAQIAQIMEAFGGQFSQVDSQVDLGEPCCIHAYMLAADDAVVLQVVPSW
jgi:hypothetical protein